METPEMDQAATAAAGDSVRGRRRRRRLMAAIVFFLLLLILQFAASVLRSPGQDLSAITSAFAVLADGAGEDFVISGTVTALPACTEPAALVPGLDRCIVYSVHNPRSAPITVTSISISDVDDPPGCPGGTLDVARASFAGAITVPSGATVVVPGRPIALRDTAADQDGCRGATFSFTFTGSARNGAGTP